jgi:hypothetical protein
VAAAERIPELDRRVCRDSFDRRFTAAAMAKAYLDVYQQLTRGKAA